MKSQKTSDYSISDGRFHIAKAHVGDKVIFTLWDKFKTIGHWSTAETAKARAQRILDDEADRAPNPESLF